MITIRAIDHVAFRVIDRILLSGTLGTALISH
jgi:hypothetical protein